MYPHSNEERDLRPLGPVRSCRSWARRMSAQTSLSAQEYLEKHNVPFYLRDAVSLLLLARDERPLELLAEYFSEVISGKHVLCREFSFINQSAHNRWAFISSLREAFAGMDGTTLLSAAELLQLLRLVCPDFPDALVRDACKLCGKEEGNHRLSELLHCTYARLFYAEFLRRIAITFRECDPTCVGRVSRRVLSHTLRDTLANMSLQFCVPPANAFKEVVGAADQLGDATVAEMQQAFMRAPSVRELLASTQEQVPFDSADGAAPRSR